MKLPPALLLLVSLGLIFARRPLLALVVPP